MRLAIFSGLLFLLIVGSTTPATATVVHTERATTTLLNKREIRQQKRAERKATRRTVRDQIRAWRQGQMDSETLLLVLIAILVPPLAMFLYDGNSNRFIISLVLWLAGLLSVFLFSWLGMLPAIVYTLYIILSEAA